MRTVCFLFFSIVLAASATTHASLLDTVSNEAWFALSSNNLSDLREGLKEHPVAEVLGDEDLQAILTPDGPEERSFQEVMEQDFRLSVDEFFELFPGEVHLVVYGFGDDPAGGGQRPEWVLLAEFAGDEERLEELMQVQFERNAENQREVNPAMEHHLVEETFMDETLFFDEAFNGEEKYIEDGYALVDGVFILATPESRLRGAVEGIKDGIDKPFSSAPGFLRMAEAESSDLSLYLNFPAFIPRVNETLREAVQGSSMVGFGVTGDSLVEALALQVLEAFYIDLRLLEDGVLMRSGLTYREKRGVAGLFTYGRGELHSPSFVPEDPVSTSVTLFDASAFYEEILRLLAVASPSMAQMLELQIQILETNLGIPLRESLIQNLDTEMTNFAVFDAAAPGETADLEPRQVIAFSVRDAEAFSSAVDGLIGQNAGLQSAFERKEFNGHTIRTVPGRTDPSQPGARLDDFSYAVSRSHAFLSIGRESVLMDCLGRLDASGGGFWQRDEIDDWFEPIRRPKPVSRSYTDVEALTDSILGSVGRSLAGITNAREAGGMPDFDKLSAKLELPFILLAEMNEEEDGFYSRALLQTKPEEGRP